MDVSLRTVREDDFPALHAHQADAVAWRMAGFAPRDRAAFDAHWRKILADPTVEARAVVVDGALAGHVVSFERDGVREVGYWIDRELWGRGIATSALARFLAECPRRPLYAIVSPKNSGSLRVLEKCGFVEPTAEERAGRDEGSSLVRILRR